MRLVIRGVMLIGIATIVGAVSGSADAGSKSAFVAPKVSARKDAGAVSTHHAHHGVDTNLGVDALSSHHKNKSTATDPEQRHADRDWEHKHPPATNATMP
jgi:hypothetical protein